MNIIEKITNVIPTLNSSQIEAITTTEGPLLIIAGPGTGKTLTIVARTLYILLTNKATPDEILLTTFTEKASFELRDRLNQSAIKIGYKNNLHQLKVGTIHSICNDFIMKFLNHTPLKKGYVVLDELTQMFFIYENFKEVIPEINGKFLGKWQKKWDAIKNIVLYYNKITEEMIEPENLKLSNNDFLKLIAESYHRYKEKLFEKNRIDFSHLQRIFFDLLQNKDLYPKIKQKIKYVMVDEYQDTNFIQERILLTLAHPENNICVVGDEDQSLYRFRGATVRNILEFHKNFKDCKIVKLTINYRSHKEIIDRYNNFINSIDWQGFRFKKQILPNPEERFPDYPAVFSIWSKNKKDEAERIIKLLKFLKENRIIKDWSDVAILLKSIRSEHSGHYIDALRTNSIPVFAPRAKVFFENTEIKLLLACYTIILGFHKNLNDYIHR
ncbi:MAG: ATP-dependent helicase, partial [bacterium]|nr:ATP-dependent helicase [bacterium]